MDLRPQLKEDYPGQIVDGEENVELAAVKSALNKVLAAESRAESARVKFNEEVSAARRQYGYEIRRYNEVVLKPRVLKTLAELRAYTESLSLKDISRSCFVTHEGTTEDFPCVVITIRVASTSHEQTYHHKFLSKVEVTALAGDLV